MGFCLFNNAAVDADAALAKGLSKVAIVDWDVHHGNGTQDIFWEDPRVLYLSLHQFPFYPGTGAPDEIGGPGALGATVNVGLPAGSGDRDYLAAFDEVLAPSLERFRPDLILVSAGFDAHRADPLAMADTAVMMKLCAMMSGCRPSSFWPWCITKYQATMRLKPSIIP